MSDIMSAIGGFAPAVLESLINATLIGILVSVVVLLIMRRSQRLNAATRHGIWWITLIVVVALPVVWLLGQSQQSSPSRLSPGPPERSTAATNDPIRSIDRHMLAQVNIVAPPVSTQGRRRMVQTSVERQSSRAVEVREEHTVSRKLPQRESRSVELTMVSSTAVPSSTTGSLWDNVRRALTIAIGWVRETVSAVRWSPYEISPGSLAVVALAVILVMGTVLMLRLSWGYRRLISIKRRSRPLPGDIEARLIAALPTAHCRRRVRIRQASGLGVPMVVGLFRPIVLFPAELLDELTESDLENIALHEYAHVCRWDDWTNLLQRIMSAVFFFNPAVRLIGTQLCLEREIACDDWVIAQTGRTRAYATCLTKLVTLTPWTRRYAPAPSALRTKSQFSRRIETLLNRKRNASPRISRLSFFAAAVVMSVMTFQMTKVPPVVAVFDPVESLLRGDVPLVTEALPRVGRIPAPLAPTPVGCAEVVHDCNLAIVGCADAGVVAQAATVRPANAISYAPAPDRCQWCNTNDCNWNVNGEWDRTKYDNVTARITDYLNEHFSTLSNDQSDRASLYTIQYRHGTSEEVTERRLRQLLAMGITGNYVREIRQAGLENVTIGDLVTLKRHAVDGKYIDDLTRAGLKYLTVDDVIRLRRNRVAPEDVAALSTQFGDDVSVDDVIELHRRGVSGDYVTSMGHVDLSSWSIRDFAILRDNGIGAEFVEAAMAFANGAMDIDELISLKSNGVSKAYLERLSDLDISGLNPDDVVVLRSNGVDPEFIAAVYAFDPDDASSNGIVTLRANGVDERFLGELMEHGLSSEKLSVDDILALRANGVDPEFTARAMSQWNHSLPVEDVILLRVNGISVEYLDELKALEVHDLSPRDVIVLRQSGVDAELVSAALRYDFGHTVDVGDIVDLQSNGVSPEYIDDLRNCDHTFSVEDMIALRANGVTPRFIEDLRTADLPNLSAQEIIEMRALGLSPQFIEQFQRRDNYSR